MRNRHGAWRLTLPDAAENVALDAMIEIRRILDKAKADYKKAVGEREWDEVEEEIKERVFEE